MDDAQHLSQEEKDLLLKLARNTIDRRFDKTKPKTPVEMTPNLTASSGAFVTLHKRGALRGCIGRFTSDTDLTDTVAEMAQSAAFEDPRFPPLRPDELDDVDFEISVLTPMKKITDVNEIEVGRHGIYIIQGPMRGVLLPQVATEQGWDRKTFLDHTCLKAGLTPNCWQSEKTDIYIFSAEIFSEK
jgi:AmmeMemoRadiSam system protein A